MAERSKKILLFWDCPECGHSHVEGPTQRCPRCFWWRDRQVEFYEANDSRLLTPEEEAQYTRPDWICKVCGASNADTGQPVAELLCGSCNSWQTNSLDLGSDRPEDANVGAQVATVRGQWQEGFRVDEGATSPPPPPKKSGGLGKKIVAGAIALGIGGTGFGAWQLFSPDIIDAEITQRTWTVNVEIQEQRPVSGSGWNLPSGAYNVNRREKQRTTRKVQTGTTTENVKVSYQAQTGTKEQCRTTSDGNGVGTRTCRDVPVYTTKYRTETKTIPVYRNEPVYDTWYTYTEDKWGTQTTVSNNGVGDSPRTAPAFTLDNQPYPERSRPPQEICYITGQFEQDNQVSQEQWSLPCAQYDRLKLGETVTLERQGDKVKLADDTADK
ncbi:MAG: hypothetical protein ACFCA4_10775 [Cyanophyceae cyanobacterium]